MSGIVPPPLRDALKIGKLVQQGELSYVIKEPDKQEYYHFNDAQYDLMQLFNGVWDLERIVFEFNRRSELYEFDVEDAEALYESCREFQLLKRTKSEQNAALLEKIREERKKKILQGKGSILFLRFQLLDPNQMFDRIINRIRFFWHPNVVKAQAMFIGCAILVVLFQGERFFDDFSRVYLQTQENSLGLFGVWLIALAAIAVHECGHGLTCKHFGGEVHEMGFLLLAFQPCLYCNVNDAWLFESKWQKIYVALAGVWVEMLLAAVSAFIWLLVDVGNPIGYIAFVLLTIGTATSLLVNLNPLLKFDGYYILTDILEMQNLRQNSIAWFSYSLKTKILRMDVEAPLSPSRKERRIYLIYGALVTLYMIFILSFIALLGYGWISANYGFLANIAFIYLIYFLVRKITGSWGETLITWAKATFWGSVLRKRLSIAMAFTLLLILLVWQPSIRVYSKGIVEAPTQVLYAPENAFVAQLAYDDRRDLTVPAGQPLVTFTSPELELQQQQLRNDQSLLQMQLQEASATTDTSMAGKLMIQRALLNEQLRAIETKLQSLVLYRPEGQWIVDGMPPQSMLGRYYSSGDEVLTLVAKTERFIDVVVDQRDLYLIKVGDSGRIRFTGVAAGVYDATIKMIAPLAKLDGAEQSVLVRMGIIAAPQLPTPPLGLSAQTLIFGQPMPLWRHILHSIRKILRADLWL